MEVEQAATGYSSGPCQEETKMRRAVFILSAK
jgi:hypothetical protein